MLRASTVLSHARLDKELNFSEVSKKLKIPQKYLQAIEEEDQPLLPQEPYCSLIIKDYANFLGLNGDEVLRIFRRDFNQKKTVSTKTFLIPGLTPNFIFRLSLLFLFFIFFAYLFSEYLSFNRPPRLTITWPEKALLIDNVAKISGQTDSEATVSVNGDLVLVDQNGKFTANIKVPESGLNIIVESRSIAGKITSLSKSY
jgi:cytoskeletal protein RodZ